MRDTHSREASTPNRTTDGAFDQASLDSDDHSTPADGGDQEALAPLFANLAPRPSALGVTYSLI